MDAVMYLKEKARMTNVCGASHCADCPLNFGNNGMAVSCTKFEGQHTEQAIAIVKKWSKDHPKKTYLSDLLEKYPNTPMHDDGVPMYVCPYYFGYVSAPSDGGCDNYENCVRCWNTPMEE